MINMIKCSEVSVLIPARGGSKRIPNKNIVDLNGKPLIVHSIEECLKVTPSVYVSTDSFSIAKIASQSGAMVIERPDEISQDNSKTEEAIEHFLSVVDTDVFACVQATTPLLRSEYLRQGIESLSNFDSVISVTERIEYLWSESGIPINWEIGKRKRTQDTEKFYCENGSFYMTSRESFQKRNCLYDGRVGFVVMPALLSKEIDTEEDLEYVRKLQKVINA